MSLHSLMKPAADEGTVGIIYLRRRLGQDDYKERRLVNYISKLVKECGFPPPLPALKGTRLVHEVNMGSKWIRAAVEAWLDDFLPPDNAMSMDRAAMAAAASDMDAAAANLGNLRVIAGGQA